MARGELVLVISVYPDAQEALRDLRELSRTGPLADSVSAAAILDRTGGRTVLQHGGGGTLAYAIGTGAAAGIVAGVLVAVPLFGAAAGAAVGALVGRRLGRREVTDLEALLGDTIVPGSAGLLAVVDEEAMDLVRGALDRALRVTGRVLDDGPLTDLALALVRGNPVATEALDRQRGRGD